jgi:V/A-type H+-transporting ATPase subunit I
VAGLILCAGNRLRGRPTLGAFAAGLGHLAQGTFEMLLNTVSFARVGAFALAYAALGSVVVIMADGMTVPALAILIAVIGNLVVIVLEGVVVSIQATRLVLFEFFMQFFAGEGRQFRPVLPPRTGDTRGRRAKQVR